VHERSRVLACDSLPAQPEFLPGAQPLVFLAEPARQVIVDALENGIQLLEAEGSVVLDPVGFGNAIRGVCGQLRSDVVLVGEPAEDLLPADPVDDREDHPAMISNLAGRQGEIE
jgi:hypothetical protein